MEPRPDRSPANHEDEQPFETILVVEDELDVQRVICITLELQGYRVLRALTIDEALVQAAEVGQIDLLLSDVILPVASGPEIYRRLQETQVDLRVLFISGYSDEVLAGYGISSQDPNFLSKPFTSAILGRKVRHIMGKGAS